jgi:hypothetical protein
MGQIFSAVMNANYYDLLSIIYAISYIDYDLIGIHPPKNRDSETNKAFVQERANSIFYKQHQDEQERVSELMLLSGKANERLWKTIYLAKVKFSDGGNIDPFIKEIGKSLTNFSLFNEKLVFDHSLLAKDMMANARISSNTERNTYVDKWMPKIVSKLSEDREQLKLNSVAFNSEMDKLLNYLEERIRNDDNSLPS